MNRWTQTDILGCRVLAQVQRKPSPLGEFWWRRGSRSQKSAHWAMIHPHGWGRRCTDEVRKRIAPRLGKLETSHNIPWFARTFRIEFGQLMGRVWSNRLMIFGPPTPLAIRTVDALASTWTDKVDLRALLQVLLRRRVINRRRHRTKRMPMMNRNFARAS